MVIEGVNCDTWLLNQSPPVTSKINTLVRTPITGNRHSRCCILCYRLDHVTSHISTMCPQLPLYISLTHTHTQACERIASWNQSIHWDEKIKQKIPGKDQNQQWTDPMKAWYNLFVCTVELYCCPKTIITHHCTGLTCSFITMNMGTVAFESVPHTRLYILTRHHVY